MALTQIVPFDDPARREPDPADIVFVDADESDILTASTLGHHRAGGWPKARTVLAVPAGELAHIRAALRGEVTWP